MRLLGKVALGGGLVSAVTAGVLVATGVFATSAKVVKTDPPLPPVAARPGALTAFDSCADLLAWYVDNNVKDVGPYGWNEPFYDLNLAYADGGVVENRSADLATVPKAITEQSSSSTGTNTQEVAVDEPDVAKTNGTLVARIVGDKRLVLIDVSGAEPVVTRRLHLPKGGYDNQLLLIGDRVLITQQTYDLRGNRIGVIEDKAGYYGRGRVTTRVLDVDISDPFAPRLVSTDEYSGTLLSARQYGDEIRFVTATGRPELAWVTPTHGVTRREATRSNRALVRRTTIEDWLPTVTRDGKRTTLTECADVLHPKTFTGEETVAVTTVNADHLDEPSAVGITASGQIVYSSADRLYVASTDYPDRGQIPRIEGDLDRAAYPDPPKTAIHAFDVSGKETSYLGSGTINGSLRDRWSLDEHDGRLRVAWTTTGTLGRSRNGITVLAEKNGALTPTGSVRDLGIDEDLQSVRWFDDFAVLVTFRQVDPLYTIDLTDQDHPILLGALKIPGYSGYLHPVGDHLLLGLGLSGDQNGLNSGSQAAVFDISDLRHPVRVSQKTFGNDTAWLAIDDPRAFTWVADSNTAVTPLADWRDNSANLEALDISPAGQLSTRTLTDLNHDWQARTFALPDGRIAVLDSHRVRVVAG